MGAYLFYAQHNFPGVTFSENNEWAYEKAALESSSYMEMNPVMAWLTGNIGYHHIHHLNSKIPFYRLPEVMTRFKELQHCKRTSLKIKRDCSLSPFENLGPGKTPDGGIKRNPLRIILVYIACSASRYLHFTLPVFFMDASSGMQDRPVFMTEKYRSKISALHGCSPLLCSTTGSP